MLDKLDGKFKLKTRVVKSLLTYTENAQRAFASGVQDEEAAEAKVVVGRYGHRDTVNTHLSFLVFFLSHGFLLETNEINDLWDALITQPAIPKDRQVGFNWILKVVKSEKRYPMRSETLVDLFQQKMLSTDPDSLSQEGVACFLRLFLRVNSLGSATLTPKLRLELGRDEVVCVLDFDLAGLSYLWRLATLHSNPTIATTAVQRLRELYTHADPKMGDEEHYDQVRSILSTLNKPLNELTQESLVRKMVVEVLSLDRRRPISFCFIIH
jgi:hypothetical protein